MFGYGYCVTRRLLRRLRYAPALNPVLVAGTRFLQWLFKRPLPHITEYIPKFGIVTLDIGTDLSMRLWGGGYDAVTQHLFWHGLESMEPEVVAVFRQMVGEATCFLDVGAHIGFYSLLGAILNPGLDIHAFEPYEPVFRRFERNIEINGIRTIKANCLALGDRRGEAPFFVQESMSELNWMTVHQSCNPNAIEAELFGLKEMTVAMESGDAYCQRLGLGRVDLIKLDTELTEDKVLDGLRKTLRRDRPVLLCEVRPDFPDHAERIWARLFPLDYRVFRLTSQGPIPLPKLTVHPNHLNYLFLPVEKDLF